MSRRIVFGALLIILVVGVSTAAAAPVSLFLPQSTAFSVLGHSCGGIQEQAFATGFAVTSGYPTGAVYIQTRCGGSGRGGGYQTTTYSAWVGVTWDFAANVVSSARLTAAPAVSPTFSATDAYGDRVYNTGTAAYLAVPVPAAPTGLVAVQVGDQFQVSWKPALVNPAVITSSTLKATSVGSSAPIVTTTVTGTATSGLVGPLQPQTTYQISVVNTDAAGSSPASSPITATTRAASVVPSAPTGVTAHWTAPGYPTDRLLASWQAAVAGDSPVDQYQITVTGSDGGGTFTQTLPGTTLSASFAVSDIPDWSVTVRAHNSAGWGPWSAVFGLGGI
jgi:hypothetical protein